MEGQDVSRPRPAARTVIESVSFFGVIAVRPGVGCGYSFDRICAPEIHIVCNVVPNIWTYRACTFEFSQVSTFSFRVEKS